LYLTNRLYVLTGIVLIGIAVCLVPNFVLHSSYDPTAKGDVAKYLKDTYDNRSLFVVSEVIVVALDAGFTMLIAGLSYLCFRDRSRLLATTFLVAFIGSSVLSCVNDGLNGSTLVLAYDFMRGGAGVKAGDPTILEVTHAIAAVEALVSAFGTTMLSIAFFCLGWLIAKAPAGRVNPPRAIGWILVIDAIATMATWLQFATDAAFVAFLLFALTTLIFAIWLGVWLIVRNDTLPVADAV
jgi:Domain of unknown function (DUF4386)